MCFAFFAQQLFKGMKHYAKDAKSAKNAREANLFWYDLKHYFAFFADVLRVLCVTAFQRHEALRKGR